MARRHCFCNYAASDVHLSLASVLLTSWCAGGGGCGSPGSCGQVVFRSPWKAQTGATGEIGIVLMAPRAPGKPAAEA